MKKIFASAVALLMSGCGGLTSAFAEGAGGRVSQSFASISFEAGVVLLGIWAIALMRFRAETKRLRKTLEGENGGRKRGD